MFSPELLYHLTYGLYIVSAKAGDAESGFVSNTVMQVSATPALVAIAVSKNNFTCELIQKSNYFNVSIVAQSANRNLIGTFGYKCGRDLNKFENIRFTRDAAQRPVVTEDCLAWFGCKVQKSIELETHLVFIGEIMDGDNLPLEGEPMTYTYYRNVMKGKSPKNAPTFQQSSIKTNIIMDRYECDMCGYVYDPAKGDPDNGIAPGTPFEQLPSTWTCPICGVDKSNFSKK